MRVQVRAVLLLVVAAVLAVACGTDTAAVTSVGSTDTSGVIPELTASGVPAMSPVPSAARLVAEETHQAALTSATWRIAEPEELLYGAGAIVVADVKSVAGPFWNQADGQYWEPEYSDAVNLEGGDYTNPILYREVTLNVTRVLRDDIGVVEGPLVILVRGGGTAAELDNAHTGGVFEEGTRVVVLIQYRAFYLREGPIDAYQPMMIVQGEVPLSATGSGAIRHIEFESIDALDATIDALRSESHEEWEWIRHPAMAADILRYLEEWGE